MIPRIRRSGEPQDVQDVSNVVLDRCRNRQPDALKNLEHLPVVWLDVGHELADPKAKREIDKMLQEQGSAALIIIGDRECNFCSIPPRLDAVRSRINGRIGAVFVKLNCSHRRFYWVLGPSGLMIQRYTELTKLSLTSPPLESLPLRSARAIRAPSPRTLPPRR